MMRYWWTCLKCGHRSAGHPIGGYVCTNGRTHSYVTPSDADEIRAGAPRDSQPPKET